MLELLLEFIVDLLFFRWMWRDGDDSGIPWWTILMVILLVIGVALLIAYLCGVL